MKYCIFIFMLFAAAATLAEDSPALKLRQENELVYVVLTNLGDQSIKVRRDYLLDRLFGNLSFDIRQSGRSFPETAHINPEPPTESTYVVLDPGQINGHVFDLSVIKSMYSLRKGCYSVTAVYGDGMAKEFSAFEGELRSNPIKLCFVGEDKHRGATEH